MSVDSLSTIPGVPTKESLLEILRRSLPPGFYEQLETHESFAIFRAIAAQWAAVAQSGAQSIAARYHLPSALQRDAPAASFATAFGEVTLIRDGVDNQPALVIDPGQMRLVGPGSRIYQNVDGIVWNPNDTGERVVTFECEVPGATGNLYFVEEDDGTVSTELVSLQDQDVGRTATGGTLVAGANPILYDSGVPAVFIPTDVGLYVEVVSSATPSNVGKIRRIVGFEQPNVESPPGSGRYPNYVLLDPTPRENVSEAILEDDSAATFTYYTAEAGNETLGDFPLFPATPTVDDAVYFGHYTPFTSVVVDVDQAGVGDWTLVWEYWSGAAWTAIPGVTDNTSGWQVAGETSASWALPAGWAALVSPGGSGLSLFFVRARLSVLTVATTVPEASRTVVRVQDNLVSDSGSLTWKLRDFDDLGVSIEECEAFSGGTDNDLWVLGDNRGIYQQDGEHDDTFRQRVARLLDVVSPAAIKRAIDAALSPYGFHGDAFDVGDGLTGMFADVDFLDYYTPGDVYPTDPWKLGLSFDEAYGFFLVVVPYLSLGEFGSSLDEGPISSIPDGSFVDSASDYAFLDGYPVTANGIYASIWSTVNRIEAGGILFDMVRSEDHSVPAC